jgi:hypothetical protein
MSAFVLVPLLAACPKKEPPPPLDAGYVAPVPTPSATEDFAPLTDDAGADAGVDAGQKPKWTGPAVNTNVARLKQCCAQLSAQAKQLGNSPEAGFFTTAAAQCNATAAQVGPSGNAPELGVIRTLLQGKTVPNACAGF